MKQTRWIRTTVLACAAMMLFAACSSKDADPTGQAIDPPPAGWEAKGDGQGEDSDLEASLEPTMKVTLYAKDPNGYVAPVTVNMPLTEGVARKTLEYMVEGGPGEALLPEGFTALLPKGTVVQGLDINKQHAIVDFSSEFVNYNPQDERKILEAVTWALTGFDTVDKVTIWVDGQPLTEMPVHGTPVDGELTRKMGINLEWPDQVNIGMTVPVTVYFMDRTAEDYSYLVPVTRFVERTDDLAQAALKELLKGPREGTGLASVVSPDIGLLGVSLADDRQLVSVNFDDKLLGMDNKIPATAAQAVILSLSETTGAPQVQLMVNGDSRYTSTDNLDFTHPVNRPVHINPYHL